MNPFAKLTAAELISQEVPSAEVQHRLLQILQLDSCSRILACDLDRNNFNNLVLLVRDRVLDRKNKGTKWLGIPRFQGRRREV